MKTKLFLIPGLMCTEKIWSKLNFNEEFDLTFLKIPEKESLTQILDTYKLILKKEEKINLLGFSLGGYISLAYAAKYPNKIKKVYTISSGISSLKKEEIQRRIDLIKLIEDNKINSLSFKVITKLLEDAHNLENIKTIQEMFSILGINTYKNQLLSTLYRNNLYPTLSKLKIPIKFVYSKNDYIFEKTNLNKLILNNTQVEQKILDSNSHMLPLEYNDILNKDIRKFFKE